MKRLLMISAAAFLIAAPISVAQTTNPTPTPAPVTQPSQPAPPTTAAPAPTTPPPTVPAPSPSPPIMEESSATGRIMCRTVRNVGERCSCLSAPTNFGVARESANGGRRNVCVADN
jgi:hypothetical protein